MEKTDEGYSLEGNEEKVRRAEEGKAEGGEGEEEGRRGGKSLWLCSAAWRIHLEVWPFPADN